MGWLVRPCVCVCVCVCVYMFVCVCVEKWSSVGGLGPVCVSVSVCLPVCECVEGREARKAPHWAA